MTTQDIGAALLGCLSSAKDAVTEAAAAAGVADLYTPFMGDQTALHAARDGFPPGSAQRTALDAALWLEQAIPAFFEDLQYGGARSGTPIFEHHLAAAHRLAQRARTLPKAAPSEARLSRVNECEHNGVVGLMVEGYASRFGETDLDGQVMQPGAFDTITETWGAQGRRILWNHGRSGALGYRAIGYAVKHRVDDTGLFIRAFLPRDPGAWAPAALDAYTDVYGRIARGAVTGFSVAGTYPKTGADITAWSMSEVSITDSPCLPSARFALVPGTGDTAA